MRHVAGISWPRSGHHLLVNILQEYFGERLNYCEFYSEHLDCCRSYPCERRDTVSFVKNHDFNLDVRPSDDPHIIQYRRYTTSIVSDFELAVMNGHTDTAESFQKFATARSRIYVRFVQKWILDPRENQERYVLSYEDLIKNPLHSCQGAIEMFEPGEEVDVERLAGCINSTPKVSVDKGVVVQDETRGIKKDRDVTAFRFYDREYFALLEAFTRFDALQLA